MGSLQTQDQLVGQITWSEVAERIPVLNLSKNKLYKLILTSWEGL